MITLLARQPHQELLPFAANAVSVSITVNSMELLNATEDSLLPYNIIVDDQPCHIVVAESDISDAERAPQVASRLGCLKCCRDL